MPGGETFIPLLTRVALLIGLGAMFAVILRASGIAGGRPAAAVVGGILAGLLLGPAVGGRALPELHERVFVGGAAARAELEGAEHQRRLEREALQITGVTGAAVRELDERHEEQLQPFRDRHRDAVEAYQRHGAWVMVVLTAAACALAAWGAWGRTGGGSRRRFDDEPDADEFADDREPGVALGAVASAGAVVLFAGIPTAVLLAWLLRPLSEQAVAVGAAVAAGSLFAGLPMRWIPMDGRAGGAGRLVRLTGIVAAVMAACVLAWAAAPGAVVWLIIPAWGVGMGLAFAKLAASTRRGRDAARGLLVYLFLPGLAAYVAHRIDPFLIAGSWRGIVPVVVAAVAAGDGHFIGAWLALNSLGRDRDRARSYGICMEIVLSGVGLTQVCFGVVLLATGLVDPSTLFGSAALAVLLANAAVIELSAGVNRRLLRLINFPRDQG